MGRAVSALFSLLSEIFFCEPQRAQRAQSWRREWQMRMRNRLLY